MIGWRKSGRENELSDATKYYVFVSYLSIFAKPFFNKNKIEIDLKIYMYSIKFGVSTYVCLNFKPIFRIFAHFHIWFLSTLSFQFDLFHFDGCVTLINGDFHVFHDYSADWIWEWFIALCSDNNSHTHRHTLSYWTFIP